MKTTIYITRHGETVWNIDKRFQGWGNSPLTDLGKKQANTLRNRLRDMDIDVIYTSPIGRAYETAEILKGDKSIEVIAHEGIKEVNFGLWEGMTTKEISEHKEYGTELHNLFNNPNEYKPFGGETLRAVRKRCEKAVMEIIDKNRGENILIVTHGMTIKLLMLLFENVDAEEVFSTEVMGQASLTKVEFDGNEFKVVYKNDKSHYGDDFITKGW